MEDGEVGADYGDEPIVERLGNIIGEQGMCAGGGVSADCGIVAVLFDAADIEGG